MILALLIAALSIVAPKDGVRVSTQSPLKLEWRGGDPGAVYLLNVSRQGGAEELFVVSNRTSAFVVNMEIGSRYDWLVRQAGTLDSAAGFFMTTDKGPRLLRADGVRNFRDAGGWKTVGGRRVKQNMLFLSASLDEITESGVEMLRKDFGIRTDIDLRDAHDVSDMRMSALGEDVCWRNIPLDAGARVDGVIRGREPFAKIFGMLIAKENYPFLLRCENGKDRTGTLVFLLNALLGVPMSELQANWPAVPELLQELTDYLKTRPGVTIGEKAEAYARGCGITAEEIVAFRALMLE